MGARRPTDPRRGAPGEEVLRDAGRKWKKEDPSHWRLLGLPPLGIGTSFGLEGLYGPPTQEGISGPAAPPPPELPGLKARVECYPTYRGSRPDRPLLCYRSGWDLPTTPRDPPGRPRTSRPVRSRWSPVRMGPGGRPRQVYSARNGVPGWVSGRTVRRSPRDETQTSEPLVQGISLKILSH